MADSLPSMINATHADITKAMIKKFGNDSQMLQMDRKWRQLGKLASANRLIGIKY